MSLCFTVEKLCSTSDVSLKAVVGPYKLYGTSFNSLHGNNWLTDEVNHYNVASVAVKLINCYKT